MTFQCNRMWNIRIWDTEVRSRQTSRTGDGRLSCACVLQASEYCVACNAILGSYVLAYRHFLTTIVLPLHHHQPPPHPLPPPTCNLFRDCIAWGGRCVFNLAALKWAAAPISCIFTQSLPQNKITFINLHHMELLMSDAQTLYTGVV